MSYAAAHAWERQAAERGVSTVARSARGFMRAYQHAGSFARLSPWWKRRRAGFIARHMATDKPRLARTPVRIDRTLHRLARACAKRDGRSLNPWLTWVVRQAVAAAPAPKQPEAPEPPPALG